MGNYYSNKGGISALIRNLFNGLSENGEEVAIHSVGGRGVQRFIKYLKLPYAIFNATIIHLHGCSSWGLLPVIAGYFFGSIFRRKMVITYHGSTENVLEVSKNFFFNRIVSRTTLITTPSKSNSEIFHNMGFRSMYIPNIFDDYNWPFKERSEIAPTFICTRSKYRPQIVIDTFTSIEERIPVAKLKMLGQFNDSSAFGQVSLKRNIEVVEEVPRSMVSTYLNSCDIYINSCDNDSFGYSIYEAISCGLIVVSVHSSSLLDSLGNDVILFSDENKLSDSIFYILENQNEAKLRIAKGRKVIGSYSWSVLSNKWLSAYFGINPLSKS